MSSRDNPKYADFAEFLAAYQRGEVLQDKLRLACWSGSCAVTIEQEGDPIVLPGGYDDVGESTLLVRADTAEQFAFDVIAAFGGEGRMA